MLGHTTSSAGAIAYSQHEKISFEDAANGQLVEGGELSDLLGFKSGAAVDDIIQSTLLNPLRDLTSNRGKRIRGQLVTLSYGLVADGSYPSIVGTRQCRTCAEILELIHAGSLVVDDIEDGSRIRRGKPALHVRYGLPIALNAGNWLYFWPLQLIKTLELPSRTTLSVYEYYHRTLLRAHFGQAIDLGSRVDTLLQARVSEVCRAAMELKTGALMGFAMVMGAVIGRATEAMTSLLDKFGLDLGIALQMFDDLGNVLGVREAAKKYEDLVLHRPSWAWGCAAKMSAANDYEQFVAAVGQLPDARALEHWMDQHRLIQRMRESARHQLESAVQDLQAGLESMPVRWSAKGFEEIRKLGEEIAAAYG